MKGVHLFPVRHHSPRTSFVLRAVLDRVKPSLVLVEGPEDADSLVDAIVDHESVPPIAILGYRTDGTPGSSLWPFAAYSPEYVALKWARENGARTSFCDISIGQSLAYREPAAEHGETPSDEEPGSGVGAQAAALRGFRSFEEFWEASFEAPAYDEVAFRAALVAYADLVRHEGPNVRYHRARDAFMAKKIERAIASGTAPERIVAVLGAAHAAALAAGDVEPGLEAMFAATVPTTATVIPYSFPRLAEQTGYGAGNRAPQFYQRAWDNGLSFRRAALEVLVEFCDHLRLRGFMASLADTIEAYRLACTLAEMRGKGEPGLDEIREATVATMCRGDASHVDTFLWPSVVGRNVGKVASRIGKNSLQDEFWREVEERKLPRTDEPEDFVLKLGDAVQVETSVFLHRLRVAEIPYASYMGSAGRARATAPGKTGEEAGGFSALARVKEAWEAQWTPATDVALVEGIVHGETLERVCERRLSARLAESTTTAQAAAILLESVVASAPETVSTALAACDRLAVADDDLPSLARASRALSGLVAYGSSRAALVSSESAGARIVDAAAAIPPLCVKTFDRAVLRVAEACVGNDDSVGPIKEALRILHEIAMSQSLVDRPAWIAAARSLALDYAVNPGCSGLAAGLLYLAQEMGEDEIAGVVELRVGSAIDPGPAASFLAGFLEVNALVIVKSRPIVQALDRFLAGIHKERFTDVLPTLRRAFSALGATERRYLVENVVEIRELGGAADVARGIVAEKDKEKLSAMSEEISKAMDDLDDLL